MARYYLPAALDQLRDQADAMAPNRSRVRDGWIGDPDHAARVSQHNPDPDGSVDALDLTHDPAGGFDVHAAARRIAASRDRRLRRVISDGMILSGDAGPYPWRWRAYDGPDPHRGHAHFETVDGPASADRTPWALEPPPRPQPVPNPTPRKVPSMFVIKIGSTRYRLVTGDRYVVISETLALGLQSKGIPLVGGTEDDDQALVEALIEAL